MEDTERAYKIISNDISQFLSLVGSGAFTSETLDRQFNYQTRMAKHYRWQILERLVSAGKLEKVGTGKYRLPDQQLKEVDWIAADVEDVVKVSWPLNLQKYVKTYHRSINIIAGSPGAGKTAFLYNFILRNPHQNIVLFTNDMTPEEIKERFNNANLENPSLTHFRVFDRNDNFGDVVEPDSINVIDYLDLNSEVYLIGEEIEKIYRKLNRGIAVIGIQKKPGQELGQGGIFSEKRSKLYLSLDTIKVGTELVHNLVIQKVRGRTNPLTNPRYMSFKFKLVGGINFLPV